MLYYYNIDRPVFSMIRSTSLDKFAVFLSGVCVLHCLITPVLITLLPIFTLNTFVEDLLFHKLMLWLVLPTSCIALSIGCRKHRDIWIASSGIIGMTLLVLIAFLGHDMLSSTGEKIATSIAVSHILNYRACQNLICDDANCSSDHHH